MERLRGTKDLYALTSGPGKLAKAYVIDKKMYGVDVTKRGELYVADDGYVPKKIVATPRIGISKAEEKKWRFVVAGNEFLSKKLKSNIEAAKSNPKSRKKEFVN